MQSKDIPGVHISNGQGNQICKFLSFMLNSFGNFIGRQVFAQHDILMFQYFIIPNVYIGKLFNVSRISCEMHIVSSLITLDVQGCQLQEMTIWS